MSDKKKSVDRKHAAQSEKLRVSITVKVECLCGCNTVIEHEFNPAETQFGDLGMWKEEIGEVAFIAMPPYIPAILPHLLAHEKRVVMLV